MPFRCLVVLFTHAGEVRLQEIASAASGCGTVLLATDPDREGEAISWHITQELQVRIWLVFVLACWVPW